MVGSDLGNSFEDSVVSTHLKEIHIRCESRVDSIRCVYADGSQTPKHGGDGGREEIFVLGKGTVHHRFCTRLRLRDGTCMLTALSPDEAVIVSFS